MKFRLVLKMSNRWRKYRGPIQEAPRGYDLERVADTLRSALADAISQGGALQFETADHEWLLLSGKDFKSVVVKEMKYK